MTSPVTQQGSARRQTHERLVRTQFDLLVIGGGILGISTAWFAAQAGLRVALIEAGDFAGATSSSSTKLVHGGLRYLQTGNLRLVAENHRERRALARDVAPHLVSPRRFVVPVYADGPHGAAKLGAGVLLYSALSGFGDGMGRLVSPRTASDWVPTLRTEGLRAAAVYTDHQMNDSRVAIMTVRAAVDAGATVLNHARVTGLRQLAGRVVGADVVDGLTGEEIGIAAARVVNASGPWVDHVRRLEDPRARPTIQLSKGAHVVVRRDAPWDAGLTIPLDESRVSFAIPWEGHVLLGTTDDYYDGDPADVSATSSDVEQILAEVSSAVSFSRRDVTCAFAGLRVLPRSDGRSSSAPRETVISEGSSGMISVAGGKWTTFRHIGRLVAGKLGAHPPRVNAVPLPGLADPIAVAARLCADGFAPTVAQHLATHYGALAHDVVELVHREPALGEQLHPDGPDIAAQVIHARDHEWAETTDDVTQRRTTLTLRGLDTADVRTHIDQLLAQHP